MGLVLHDHLVMEHDPAYESLQGFQEVPADERPLDQVGQREERVRVANRSSRRRPHGSTVAVWPVYRERGCLQRTAEDTSVPSPSWSVIQGRPRSSNDSCHRTRWPSNDQARRPAAQATSGGSSSGSTGTIAPLPGRSERRERLLVAGGRRCERRDQPASYPERVFMWDRRGPFPCLLPSASHPRLGTPLASARMSRTRLRISCVHCGRPVALVGDISLSVLTLLATHLPAAASRREARGATRRHRGPRRGTALRCVQDD